jgi:hypothetical protein
MILKAGDTAVLKSRYGAIKEIRIDESTSVIYGIPKYIMDKKSFFIESIIYFEESFEELTYEEMIKIISNIDNKFIEFMETFGITKYTCSFLVKYIYNTERELQLRLDNYLNVKNKKYSISDITKRQSNIDLLGDSYVE